MTHFCVLCCAGCIGCAVWTSAHPSRGFLFLGEDAPLFWSSSFLWSWLRLQASPLIVITPSPSSSCKPRSAYAWRRLCVNRTRFCVPFTAGCNSRCVKSPRGSIDWAMADGKSNPQGPKALRTHILRLFGAQSPYYLKAFWAILSLKGNLRPKALKPKAKGFGAPKSILSFWAILSLREPEAESPKPSVPPKPPYKPSTLGR